MTINKEQERLVEISEELESLSELHDLLREGLEDIQSENTLPFAEAMTEIRTKRNRKV